MNMKVFNLISRVHKTRFLIQHEFFECKVGLNESVCNSWCECKELDEWGSCKIDCSTCELKCRKACEIDECVDIKNCSSEKRLIGLYVES